MALLGASYKYGSRIIEPFRARHDVRQLRAQRGAHASPAPRASPRPLVELQGERAYVEYDPDLVKPEVLKNAVRELGYEVAGMKTAAPERVDLPVSGMTCAACARTIERTLSDAPGVERANVNLATSTATVEYDPARVQPGDFVGAIEDLGYGVPQKDARPDAEEPALRRRFWSPLCSPRRCCGSGCRIARRGCNSP